MKVKKIIAILLAFTMLFAVAAMTVSAASLGDINSDGKINGTDYIKLKRHVLRSVLMNDDELTRSDINGDGKINGVDYVMLKRHVLGTYKIGSTAPATTAVDTIIAAIGDKEDISITYTGVIAGFNGTADISFSIVGGVLTLRGHAVTDEGVVIDLSIPMATVSANYSFSGEATMNQLNVDASGTIVAADYSVDTTSLDVKFDSSVDISAFEKKLQLLCKEAMDQFLYQANALLERDVKGVTIADLGFTKFYREIQEGLMDM